MTFGGLSEGENARIRSAVKNFVDLDVRKFFPTFPKKIFSVDPKNCSGISKILTKFLKGNFQFHKGNLTEENVFFVNRVIIGE